MLLKGGAKPARAAPQGPRHLVWVWQFTADAEPNRIAPRLRDHSLGILLKTHDGTQWMSEYDKSAYAVSGPAQVGVLANYFESAGVPFHAWAVIHGVDPLREAKMAADVLAAGARSLYLDIEPASGFWRGTAADAVAFGRELRRLQPDGVVILSIDPRPWQLTRLPMREFTAFSNAIAPQQYWRTFNTPANYERFWQSGFPVPPEGVTPDFLVNVGNVVLGPFGLPIIQVGQGATPDRVEWMRFVAGTYSTGGETNFVTVWRYGVTTDDILTLLRDIPPKLPPAPTPAVVAEGGGVYVVKAGDTMGGIADAYGVSVDEIAQLNGLDDPSYIYVGQELKIPGGGVVTAASAGSAPSEPAADQTSQTGAARSYTVQPGDTLYAVAGKFGTTVDAIVKLNGLTDPDVLTVGQVLKIG